MLLPEIRLKLQSFCWVSRPVSFIVATFQHCESGFHIQTPFYQQFLDEKDVALSDIYAATTGRRGLHGCFAKLLADTKPELAR